MHLRPISNAWSELVTENSTKHGMHRRGSSALILIAIFFVVGELGAVRGDNVLEADGPGQNLTFYCQDLFDQHRTTGNARHTGRDHLIDPRSYRDSSPGRVNRATGAGDWKPDHRREFQHISIGLGANRNSGRESDGCFLSPAGFNADGAAA